MPDAAARNVIAELPPGFVGAPNVVPTCETVKDLIGPSLGATYCPPSAIVGLATVTVTAFPSLLRLASPLPSTICGHLPARLLGSASMSQASLFFSMPACEATPTTESTCASGVRVKAWDLSPRPQRFGAPPAIRVMTSNAATPRVSITYAMKRNRGMVKAYLATSTLGQIPFPFAEPSAFLSLPTACSPAGAGLPFNIFVDSWEQPSTSDSASFETESGVSGCDAVPFGPEFQIQATTDSAESPTGLEAVLALPAEGGKSPTGISQSHLKDATVTLPEGMTLNPGYANGVGYCSASQIGLTTGDSRDPLQQGPEPAPTPRPWARSASTPR